MNPEKPEADAAEQIRAIDEDIDEQDTALTDIPPTDADPADVADQRRIVPDDEERG